MKDIDDLTSLRGLNFLILLVLEFRRHVCVCLDKADVEDALGSGVSRPSSRLGPASPHAFACTRDSVRRHSAAMPKDKRKV
jgi:hypothetical protein